MQDLVPGLLAAVATNIFFGSFGRSCSSLSHPSFVSLPVASVRTCSSHSSTLSRILLVWCRRSAHKNPPSGQREGKYYGAIRHFSLVRNFVDHATHDWRHHVTPCSDMHSFACGGFLCIILQPLWSFGMPLSYCFLQTL